ncbi:MAG: sugar phosphate isomerase/epimerase [Opitutaceae bacterium]|nr:sugar phosphate isomerase/epimerase [Opitutaceae bacterium]
MRSYTRRDFTKLALAAVPAAGFLSAASPLRAAGAKAGSKVGGVMIGLNVPYSFRNQALNADEILTNCVQLGLSGVELRTQPVEVFLGAPAALVNTRAKLVKGAAAEAKATTLRDWRRTAPLARAGEFRAKYEAAGVAIEIVKVDGIFSYAEAELDYAFKLAKALGARAVSTEITKDHSAKGDADLARVGGFAAKHGLLVGLHGHAETGAKEFEHAFGLSPALGANLDIGHYVAGNNGSPVDFIRRHHARVTHVHIKDRKKDKGGNTPFGEGDTPIREVLRLIRDNKWPIQATIEFEYAVPAGSSVMAEIARAVKFCRDALA